MKDFKSEFQEFLERNDAILDYRAELRRQSLVFEPENALHYLDSAFMFSTSLQGQVYWKILNHKWITFVRSEFGNSN